MRRAVMALACILVGTAFVFSLGAQEVPDKSWVDEVNAVYADKYAQVAAVQPSWARNTLTPMWLLGKLRYDDTDKEWAYEYARECINESADAYVDLDRPVRWWTAKRIVYASPADAVAYLGVTFHSSPGEHVNVVVTRDPHWQRSTVVHEAVHVLCEEKCGHDASTIADECTEKWINENGLD